ncbi:MAG TPA: hypothetical protein VHD32_19225 [Candidatus Didemnitutus sp.]|nr:hypothetical protein [Candidatus Didemnitutus sp.]
MGRLCAIFLLLAAFARGQTQLEVVPAAELGHPPTAARVAWLVDTASHLGWAPLVPALRQAAVVVYRHDPAASPSWFYLYRWSAELATPQASAVRTWMNAMHEAKMIHPNLPAQYDTPPTPLGNLLSVDFQKWALGNAAFSEEFFTTQSNLDQPAEVLGILQSLWAQNPSTFATYANLALAIAVVYDVPPPPDWPHNQVSPSALPRHLPPPAAAYAYWTKIDQEGICPISLRRLSAAELKFVVDASAPLTELTWAAQNVRNPVSEFAKVYDSVPYRESRLKDNAFVWPGNDYRLATIRTAGGICIDQAYFAANSGKARGIPTLLFHGAGRDGRHAWFGYLSPNGWMLDAGRYAEQKFVVGEAFDPQTWKYLNDHELLFLSERFRALPLFKLSLINSAFAREFLADHDPVAAAQAAREAVNRDPRNLEGWETLVFAQTSARLPPAQIEGTLHSAAMAFQKYPDLEVSFSRLLIQSLRQRGEMSAAQAEEQRLVRKYQGDRADLSYDTAGEMLDRSMHDDPLQVQVQTYQKILNTYGTGAGIEFYDRIVKRFVDHCREIQEPASGLQALGQARKVLRVEPGGQLDQEMKAATAELSRPSS